MSRIAYENGRWTDINGPRPDIGFNPPSKNDYYFYIPGRDIILRWFNEDCEARDPLGEVYSVSGKRISNIPPFVHPAYRGLKHDYRSKLAWVQDLSGDTLSLVMYCPNPNDFRLKLDLRAMKYLEPEIGVG